MIRPLKPGVFGAAKFRHSADGFPIARISLHRWWDPTLAIDPITKRPADDRFRPLVVIGVNPSEAGADGDDNTSAKCITFAEREGANGLVMVNLTPEITKEPELLGRTLMPYGSSDEHWAAVEAALCENGVAFVAGWGKPPRALGSYRDRVRQVINIAHDCGRDLVCFGTNGDGSPKHPLYLPASTPLVPWKRVLR